MVTPASFWDKAAAKYDRKTVKGPNYKARIERSVQWVGPQAVVLDAGCAGGQITLDLAAHVRQITGIDISSRLITFAEARLAQQASENAVFKVASPDDPVLEPGSFDAITAFSLLHLVEDVPATLRRFYELLRPGGQLIAEFPCREQIGLHVRLLIKLMQLVGKAPDVHLYRESQYEHMFTEAGFTVEEMKIYNPASLNTSVLAIRRGE
ncbi:MAG: class I SAM-dependent methyltransferase [Planctomycetota bacterium]